MIVYFTYEYFHKLYDCIYEIDIFDRADPKVEGIMTVCFTSTIEKFDKNMNLIFIIYINSIIPSASYKNSVNLLFDRKGYLIKSAIDLLIKKITNLISSRGR